MNGTGDTASAVSLYELFFDLEDNLCKRYTSLNPFEIRREKVGEVFLLVKRINRKNQRENGIRKDDTIWYDYKGNKHIRRKAQKDDWY